MKYSIFSLFIILSSVGLCTTSENECINQKWYYDGDGDGFGNPEMFIEACEAPIDYVDNAEDPDDEDPLVYPGSPFSEGEKVCDELITYEGTITLTNQSQVNELKSLCIGSINGDLEILDSYENQDDFITDLTPLTSIKEISGDLEISRNNYLETLEGLHNIEKVGSNLIIIENPKITSLKGLTGLIEITQFIEIYNNYSLVTLEGLNNIKESNGNLVINENTALESLNGLESLEKINFLFLTNSPKIENLHGLKKLKSIFGLYLSGNDNLNSLFGSGVTPEGLEHLILRNNNSISSLTGAFSSDWKIKTRIEIIENEKLTNLDGIFPYYEMTGDIIISGNKSLIDIKALKGLSKVNRSIKIVDNDMLTNLDGLEGLRWVGIDNYNIPFAPIEVLEISENGNLTDFCALKNLFTEGFTQLIIVSSNGFNPSKEEIVSGNCSL